MVFEPINLEFMQVAERSGFELYVRSGQGYSLFAGPEVEFSEEHRRRLIEMGRPLLYAKVADARAITRYKLRQLSLILANPALEPRLKAELAYDASLDCMQRLFDDCNPAAIEQVEATAGLIVRGIMDDRRLLGELIAVQVHDQYTYQHTVNVGFLATALAAEVYRERLHEHDLVRLSEGFFLHDIGMTRVSREVLNKSEPLTRLEQVEIRHHPTRGIEVLEANGHLTQELADIVLCHHERVEGGGYPKNLKGLDVPEYARLCTVVDVFEALTAERPYRRSLSPFDALRVMRSEMRRDFDADFFRAFVLMLGGN
ncbi:MAG: Cyclic di-GMP phosphodiesterase response regulator RpfG [Deltaproteobacteria bacterium ADurb.Bin510]|nr:MAG: Cyclic di-GMP phosphodiesterase response regulator RpfG [Deltaproteobacteria bacterium ADurb.Bin510]